MGGDLLAFLKKVFRRRKKRGETIPLSYFLKMKPLRNPHLTWKRTEDGKVVIRVLVVKKGSLRRSKDSPPKEMKVELDKIGSFLWDKFDGQHTAEDLLKEVEKKFRIFRQEAELSLFRYLQDLANKGLIGFIFPPTSEK